MWCSSLHVDRVCGKFGLERGCCQAGVVVGARFVVRRASVVRAGTVARTGWTWSGQGLLLEQGMCLV